MNKREQELRIELSRHMSSRKTPATAKFLLFLWILFGTKLCAQQGTKVWTVDLASDPDFQNRLKISELLLQPPTIDFLDEGQVICTFEAGEQIGYNPSGRLLPLDVLEVDARTGSFGRKLTLQSFDDYARALPLGNGAFIVLAGGEIGKYSPTFQRMVFLPTPFRDSDGKRTRWIADVSPDSSSLVLYKYPVGGIPELDWLKTDDLSLMRKKRIRPISMLHGASNAAIVDEIAGRNLEFPDQDQDLCTGCEADFVSDDLIMVSTEKGFVIQTLAGDKRATGRLDVYADHFTRAATAHRFAFSTGHYRGTSLPLHTHFTSVSTKIRVFDWDAAKTISEIAVEERAGDKSAGFSQMALALSPDGKKLLVLLHSQLTLYRLRD